MKTTTNRFGKTSLSTDFGNIKEFLTRQNRLSDFDMNAIRAYNAQIDACVTSQTAFNRTMLNASKTAQDMVANANGNTVALNNMTRASKASELALKGLALAGNMIAGIAIAQGISFAIKKIHDFANASETARENAKQYAQSISENLSSIGSSSKKLEGLNDELQALSKGVTATGQNINLSATEKQIFLSIGGFK